MSREHKGFTPGPWRTVKLQVVGPDNVRVADCAVMHPDHIAEGLANATLIADAPALLAERDQLRAQRDELLALLKEVEARPLPPLPIDLDERIADAIANATKEDK